MNARASAFGGWTGRAMIGACLLAAGALTAVASGATLRSETSGAAALVAAIAGAGMLLGAARWVPGLLFALVPAVCVFNTRRGLFPFDIVVLGLAAYMLLDALWRGDLRLPGPRAFHVAFLAFIVSGMATLFMAQEFTSFAGSMKRIVVGYLGAMLVFRYADRRLWPWFALSIPVAGTAISLLVLRSYEARGFLIQRAFELRTFYSDVGWGTSNYVGAILALTILGSIVLLVLPGRPWLRWASALSLIPMGLCVALLVSRGTIVALGIGLAALLVAIGGRHRWKILAVGTLGAVILTQLPVFKVILLRFTLAAQSLSYVARVVHWKIALNRFLDHPMMGVGLGQGRFQTDELTSLDPHNYFLSVASETGVLGLLAWAALLIVAFRVAWVAARGDRNRMAWAASLGVLIAVAALHSSYEPTFPGASYFFLFFWIAAILLRAADPGDTERADTRR
jgi:O-antigen ligase